MKKIKAKIDISNLTGEQYKKCVSLAFKKFIEPMMYLSHN